MHQAALVSGEKRGIDSTALSGGSDGEVLDRQAEFLMQLIRTSGTVMLWGAGSM